MNTTENTRQAVATIVEDLYPHLGAALEESIHHGSPSLIMDGAVLTFLEQDAYRLEDYRGSVQYGGVALVGERELAHSLVAGSSPRGAYHAALTKEPDGWEVDRWSSSATHSQWSTTGGTEVEVGLEDAYAPNITVDYYGRPLTLRGVAAWEAQRAVDALEEHGVAAMVDVQSSRGSSLNDALKIIPAGAIIGEIGQVGIESRTTPGGYAEYWDVTIDGKEYTCTTAGQVIETLVNAIEE